MVIEALLHSARSDGGGDDVRRAVFEFAAALVAAGRVAVPTHVLVELLHYLCTHPPNTRDDDPAGASDRHQVRDTPSS